MKILFINISDIKGGAAKSMWRIGEELSNRHEVKFLVRSKYSDSDKVIEVGRNKYINIFFNLLGLQYKFLPVSRKIVKFSRRWKPDIISLNQIEGGYFQTRDLIKLSKIAPLVWTMHDLWAFMGNSHRTLYAGEKERNVYPQIGIPLGGYLLNQKHKIYQKADFKVVCPSMWLFHQKLKSICDKEGHIIPHGIDLDKFKPEKRNKGIKEILFVSEKVDKAYGLDKILSYLDGLLTDSIILTVIGEGRIEGKYKKIIIDNVGYIDDEDMLIDFYQGADVLIHPSRADVFGLVLLESLACGTPCVAYDVGGVREVIGNAGFLIKLNSHADFAFKVSAILRSKNLRTVLNEEAREQALKFDIKEIAKQYERIFNE